MGYTASPGAVISVSVEGVAASQRQIDSMAQSMNSLSNTVQNAMRNLAATVGLGGGLVEVIQLSDQYTKLTSQLRLATDSSRAYAVAYADVKRISLEAQTELAGTGVLYARIANGTRELGVGQQRVAAITEAVALSLKVSAATGEEAASAQLQLSQAFAAGALRGEEFNAVNEAAPRLMKALADGMGVPIGALKQMASEGKITSQVMADVLPKSLEQLRQEASQVQTISGAFTGLKNNVLEFTAANAQSNGTVAVLTGGINLLANNLTLLVGTLATLTAVKAATWIQSWTIETYNKVAADQASRTATLAAAQADMARVQATGAQAAATQGAIVVAREEMVARLGQANSNLVAADAAIAAATAAGVQSFALRTLRLATGELAAAELARGAALAELALLGQQQARVSAEIAAARMAEATATRALNTAQAAGAVTAGLVGRALGLLGGPLGLVITALGLGATAWSLWGSSAKQASEQAAETYEEASKRIIKGLDEQIAKNERLLQLRNAGMSKADSNRNLPVVDQIAAASQRLNDINTRRGEFAVGAGKSETEVDLARLAVLKDIAALSDKMQKNNGLTAAADAGGSALTDLIAVRERLSGVDKQYLEDLTKLQTAREKGAISEKEYIAVVSELATQTWKSSDAGKEAEKASKASMSATHKETEAFTTLIASIRSKTSENELELATGTAVTENQKLTIRLAMEEERAKRNLSAAEMGKMAALIAAAQAQLAANKVSEDAIRLQAAQQDVTKFIVASTAARTEAAAALLVEYAMYGRSADAREIAMVAVRAETDMQKKLDELREKHLPITDQIIAQLKSERDARVLVEQATLGQGKALNYASQLAQENKRFGIEYIADEKTRAYALLKIDDQMWQERIRQAGDGTDAQKILQNEYTVWYRNQALKPQLDEQKKMWDSVDQTAHDTFTSIFNSGKSTIDRLHDAIKNGLLDLLEQMTLKPWIISIRTMSMGAAATGLPGEGSGLESLPTGSAAAVNPLLSAVNTASALYKSVSGGFASIGSSIGSGVTSAGNFLGSDAIATFGKGMQGFGLDGSLGATAGYGQMAGTAMGYGAGLIGGHYLGNAIAGDYSVNHGQAVTNISSVIGAVVGGPIGAAIGGAIGGLINRAFGMGSTEVQAQGMRGTLSTGGLTGTDYQKLHQDGGWFRSDKDWQTTTPFGGDITRQFTQGLSAIESASSGFAAALGVSADTITSYSKDFDIALTGDQAANQKAIADFFTGVGDEIANKLVPNLDRFTKSGESAAGTLQRLADDFKATDQVAQLLGYSSAKLFGASGMESAAAREHLIDLAGGVSVLGQQAAFFSQNFLTEAERIAPVSAALDTALGSLALKTIPTTRAEFKGLIDDMINSGAIATDTGAKQYASLMSLEEAFAQVHPAIVATTTALQDQATAQQLVKDAAGTLLSGVDAAYSVVQTVVAREKAALQTRIDAETAVVNKVKALSDSLHGTLDGMRMPGQQAQERISAQAQLREALAAAKAGAPLPAADSLKNALSLASQNDPRQYSSYQAYMTDVARTKNDIAALARVTDDSLSVEEKTLKALEAESKQMDGILAAAQAQVAELKGQSATQLSIDQTMKGLAGAILAAQRNPIVAATGAVNTAYQSALGRAPDADGLQFWQDKAASGVPMTDIVGAIKNSQEAKILGLYQSIFGRSADAGGLDFFMHSGASIDQIRTAMLGSDEYKKLRGFAVGTNYLPETMPILAHQGERIIPAADNRELMRRLADPGTSSAVLAGAIRRLEERFARQQLVLEKIAASSKTQADVLSGADAGGYLRFKALSSK